MGNGYMLKCSKCEKNYEVVEGTGMAEAKGILNAAKHGNPKREGAINIIEWI